METEAERRERRLRRVFALLMLVVPAVVIEFLFLQCHLPVPEFRMDALGQGCVLEVIPGGGAEAGRRRPPHRRRHSAPTRRCNCSPSCRSAGGADRHAGDRAGRPTA
jgi:hypothetical protein